MLMAHLASGLCSKKGSARHLLPERIFTNNFDGLLHFQLMCVFGTIFASSKKVCVFECHLSFSLSLSHNLIYLESILHRSHPLSSRQKRETKQYNWDRCNMLESDFRTRLFDPSCFVGCGCRLNTIRKGIFEKI